MIPRCSAVLSLLLVLCSAVGAAAAEHYPYIALTIDRDVPYLTGGDPAQRLDIYRPAKTATTAPSTQSSSQTPLPKPRLLIYLHGGAWMMGSKSSCPGGMFVMLGYDVAAVEYRFSNVAKFPAQIQDCQAAVRWLRAHHEQYGFDPDHIGVVGESAGGHLAALLGTTGGLHKFEMIGENKDQSDEVQAVCDCYGPIDFTTIIPQITADKSILNLFAPGQSGDPSSDLYKLLTGNSVGVKPAMDAMASPVTYIGPHEPPFLILHGTRDNLVPVAQSEELADKLRKAGDSVVLQTLTGAGHGGKEFFDPRVLNLMKSFFDQTLKGADVQVKPIEALSKR